MQNFSVICDKCGSNDEKIFNKEEPTEIIKILGLIDNMNGLYESYEMNI